MTQVPAPAPSRVSHDGWFRELLDVGRLMAVAVPPAAVAGWVVLRGEVPPYAPLALVLGLLLSVALAWRADGAISRKLRTVASVLAAFREGDFSVRARDHKKNRLLSDLLAELNQLGDMLRDRRLGEIEAWALLRKVMAEVDVVVLAVDDAGRIKLANDSAARVLGEHAPALLGRDAAALGLGALLLGEVPRVVTDPAPLGRGRWELRRGAFRLSGEPHVLVVLSDVSGALRDQENDAWKRLIRVMGHEINNSLAPIQSISDSLQQILAQPRRPDGWEVDAASGLSVISRRAGALGRFMTAYASLARLPPPRLGDVDVARWVDRAAALERRMQVVVVGGPDASVPGDEDQLDQLLINLLKNAVDAALERNVTREVDAAAPSGAVRVRWEAAEPTLTLVVEDDGPGLGDTANLFVPFFTTKPGGTGVGLVLARQIAEAHGGSVSLQARSGGVGAEAIVRLPLRPSGGSTSA
jgi:two-component system nitrogen regulation sensor histidine kinase NtrY